MSTPSPRIAEHAIAPQFIERWSPRSFTGEEIPVATLLAFIEAARWAPSAANEQPWRFIYSRRGGASWSTFLGLLAEGNRRWAQHASALLVITSRATRKAKDSDREVPSVTHAFDTGAAWAQLALQASLDGWATHAIGGFDRERARAELAIPAHFTVQAAVAIGRQGDRALLPEELRIREAPNQRLPLRELVFEGHFRA